MVRSFFRKRNLGKAFADMITASDVKGAKLDQDQISSSSFWQETILPTSPVRPNMGSISGWKTIPFILILLIIVTIYVGRLFKLQIFEGEYNRGLADGNRIQVRLIHTTRGVIYDSKGEIMARNTPGFRLIDKDNVKFVDRDTALSLEGQNLANESLNGGPLGRLEVDTIREYPFKEASAHLLGYTSQISKEELGATKFSGYKAGDRVGRLGVEETYEQYLKGVDGAELIEVDASGQRLRVLGNKESISGNSLHLTVDAELEKVMYDSLAKAISQIRGPKTGAAVAQDPKTGAILGMVSYPAYNNNLLTHELTQEQYDQLVNNPQKPFLNRVTLGNYPPGSIFKIVSALAGLDSGKITKETEFEDVGEFFLGDQKFGNWYFIQYGRKEGILNLVRAIARSNDIFFYRVGQVIGQKVLADYAGKIGFGKISGIDLPAEDVGLVPTPEWKIRVKNEPWFPGNTLHMAIGQGDVLVTPIQISNLTSVIASSGKMFKPYIVSQVVSDSEQRVVLENKPKSVAGNLAKKENLDLIRQGMLEACRQGGTGWPFFDFAKQSGVEVGCKTGTAEFGIDKPHAWFTVFAPFNDPKITLTVLVEQGGEGSSVAGPIAKEILSWYFTKH